MCRRIGAWFVWGIAGVVLCIAAGGGARSDAATPSGDGTGAVSGRIYIDFNDNVTFDGLDVPLANIPIMDSFGPQTDDGGVYTIVGLPPGPYTVEIEPGPCADFLMNDWVGVYVLGFCPVQQLPSVEVEIVAGTTMNGDIPLPGFDGSANARVWLDGEAAPDGTPIGVYMDDQLCLEGESYTQVTGAGVAVSEFFLDVPAGVAECQGDVVSVEADGETVYSWTWNEFWQGEWVDWWYEGDYFSRRNIAEPPIFGAYGRVDNIVAIPAVEAATGGALHGDVRAIVNGRLCGGPRPLEDDIHFGGEAFYGLIVIGEVTRFGCGVDGASVTFCVGDELGKDEIENREWHEAYGVFVALSVDGTPCPALQTSDTDCDGDADAVDAFGILRLVGGFDAIAADCWNAGDTDCDGDRDAVDALVVLKEVAGMQTGLPPDCYSFVLG